ncbi:unnamed protein product [Brachionus calyciflorus]|uniref:ATP-dependent DNA helicase PIF1 n=1 Tax=Brachionus calyciflorus TaxID=104777 RepID=A0A813YP59_9BILA|nr:unnamed protein product [Brachionus calyciflorus]
MKFETVVMLEKVERQTNISGDSRQTKFIDLLPRCRNGQNTVEDWELLLENSVNLINIQIFSDATRLYLENEKVDKYNNERLSQLNMPIINFLAINSSPAARKLDSDQFGGLANSLYCAINSKVYLTANVWTNTGLVNSACGIIRDIIVAEDYKPGNLPEAILIEFSEYSGPQFFDDDEPEKKNIIPINPISFYCKTVNATRTQIPIRLGYGMTIHKSQGQTLTKAIIDLGKSEKSLGLTFVALSRLKNINDFIIVPFPYDRLTKIKNSINLIPRLNEEKRLNELIEKTLLNFKELLPN